MEEELKRAGTYFHKARGPYPYSHAGAKTTCLVNPNNPTESVLNRKYTKRTFMKDLFLPVLFLCFSLFWLYIFFREHY